MTKNDTQRCLWVTVIRNIANNARTCTCRVVLLLLFMGAQGSILAGGLSLADQQQAAELAANVPWLATTAVASHPLGLQTLSIEKQEAKNSHGVRLVRIYQYHYAYESARLLVLDLLEQNLVREQRIDTIHLPLNNLEIMHAAGIVASDPDVLEKLRAEQRRRQRAPFTDLSELDIKASIYEPMDPLHPCATQRCALMSLFDDTRTVFTTEPVVYLGSARLELLVQQ